MAVAKGKMERDFACWTKLNAREGSQTSFVPSWTKSIVKYISDTLKPANATNMQKTELVIEVAKMHTKAFMDSIEVKEKNLVAAAIIVSCLESQELRLGVANSWITTHMTELIAHDILVGTMNMVSDASGEAPDEAKRAKIK